MVYRKAYELAMKIFEVSKRFPQEERYALIGQIRRSSRSVCMNLREAWAKRRYAAHFISKLTDCDGENAETDTSLDFALDSGYVTRSEHKTLVAMNREVGKMLGSMIKDPDKFLLRPPDPCRLTPAPCPLPPAPCRLTPDSSPPLPDSCSLPPVSCSLPPVSCSLPPVSCSLPPVSCPPTPERTPHG